MKNFPSYTHLAQFLMMGSGLIATSVGYFNRKKHHCLTGIYFYPLASLIHTIIYFVMYILPFTRKIRHTIIYSCEDVFLLAEFFLIYYFVLNTLKIKSIRKFLYVIQVAYALIVLILWLAFKNFFQLALNLYPFQTIFILIPIATYYYKLVKWPPSDKLFQIPSFWTTTGLTIYFGCTAPLFFLKDFVFSSAREHTIEVNLFLINYIAYSITFLFISKAYLCPKGEGPN